MNEVNLHAWTDFVLDAQKTGVESSIVSTLDLLTGGSFNLLAGHQWLNEACARYSITVSPPLTVGTPDEVRLFRYRSATPPNPVGELALGEHSRQEFKSSLLFDRKRAANDGKARPEDLKSDHVLHSCLKTVAAFLNGDGGLIWVGISDSGKGSGIHDDLTVLGLASTDVDGFELCFRNFLTTRFIHGSSIGDYISISFHVVDDHLVARVDVTRRSRLTYLKKSSGEPELFVRQGNLTRQLRLDEVEEFVLTRNGVLTA